ncbi:MAG TPA: hypothetical protein VGP72_03260 [Planctomycetota bacterium]|jgi:uncharacterized protein YgiM (DUF1202 family)
MSRVKAAVVMALFAALPMCAHAGDGDADKKAQKKADKEKKEVVVKEEKSEQRSTGFVGFWVHTVGGGLKGITGVKKVGRMFE